MIEPSKVSADIGRAGFILCCRMGHYGPRAIHAYHVFNLRCYGVLQRFTQQGH